MSVFCVCGSKCSFKEKRALSVLSFVSYILYSAAGHPQLHKKKCLTKVSQFLHRWGKGQSCVALLSIRLMISFVVLSHNSFKVFKGLWQDWAVCFSSPASGRSPSFILLFVGRCSHRDQVVVLLVVALLLNVVFNNSTIYGQNNELVCYCACGCFGDRWPFCNWVLKHKPLPLRCRRNFIGSEVAKWHWPKIIWLPQLSFVSLVRTAWPHSWRTLIFFFFCFFFLKENYWFFLFVHSFHFRF